MDAARRIQIITSVYSPDVAGPGVYFSSLKTELEKRGRKVEVLVRPSFFAVLSTVQKGDIVLAHATPKILLTVFLARLCKKFKFVVRIGGDYFWERAVERGRFFGTLGDFYAQKRFTTKDQCIAGLMGVALRGSDGVIFTSSLLRDSYIPFFGLDEKKVHTITHPVLKIPSNVIARSETTKQSVPTERLPRSLAVARNDKNGTRLIYAGRFLKLKNLHLLLEVFAEMRKKYPNITLTLIGEGPEKQRLAVRVEGLGLKSAVIFKEPMNRDTILEEIAAHDLVVLPSLSEVSPNLLMDALAASTPFLATQENGLREVLEDTGTWFDPMSKEDFSEKLEALLSPGALEKARECITSSSYRKTWKEVAEEYKNIFKSL